MTDTKRYNLALPTELFAQLQAAADREGITVVEALRKFIKIGLLILEKQDKPGCAFIVRDGETETQILIY